MPGAIFGLPLHRYPLSKNKIFYVFESDLLNILCGRCAYYYFSHSDWKIYLPHRIEISVILE